MDERLLDALLIFVKAEQEPEWENWNGPVVAAAKEILRQRTDEAIARLGGKA